MTDSQPRRDGPALRDAILAEAKRADLVRYQMTVAQARRIELVGDRLRLTFAASQKIGSLDKYLVTLEGIATRLAGRRVIVEADFGADDASAAPGGRSAEADAERKSALKEQALADAGVQALLEVFPAEIRDVEEM